MSADIITLGELLVEIMRKDKDTPHSKIGEEYMGPFPSGAPAIFIDSAARMSKISNFSTGYIGIVGDDEFGMTIISKLKLDGVNTSQIRIDKHLTTGIAFNQYNSDGSRKFIFAPGAAGSLSSNDVENTYFSGIKVLHIMGSTLAISPSSRDACYKAIRIAKEANPEVLISFDPNLRPEMLNIDEILEICKPVLKNTDILLPSEKEVKMLAQINRSEKACEQLLNKIPLIILKQGEKGCSIYTREKSKALHIPGYKVTEIDPTGAGDCFGGAFIVAYLAGWDLEDAARFSNAVGALKVKHFGPMPDTSYETVIAFMKKYEK
jgi:sugar/nucleoside kinase (ribokinase family)